MDLIRENAFIIVVMFVIVFWVAMIASARKRQSIVEAYMARGEADTSRHNAAVEAKLDRIIAILEKGTESKNSN